MRRPGDWLRSFAGRLFGPLTMERLIDPVIADMQLEHLEAARYASMWRRFWVRLITYASFWTAVGAHLGGRLIAVIYEGVAADDWAVGRVVLVAGAVIAFVLSFMELPFLVLGSAANSAARSSLLVLYLLPGALVAAMPAGLPFGVLWGLRTCARVNRVRAVVLVMAVCGSLVSFASVALIVPEANQAFRAEISAVPSSRLQRGANELQLRDLKARIDEAELNQTGMSREALLSRLSLHNRLALAFAPVVFGLLALGLLESRRRAPITNISGVVGFLLYLAYYTVPDFPQAVEDGLVSPIAVAWTPNAIAFILALILLSTASRRSPNFPITKLPNY